jgi:hypothetical protein
MIEFLTGFLLSISQSLESEEFEESDISFFAFAKNLLLKAMIIPRTSTKEYVKRRCRNTLNPECTEYILIVE